MKRNKILSSAFVMTMVSFGAFGADKIITSANTCTVDVLGVSDNNATANTIATWTLNEYECPAGQYLVSELDGTIGCTMCPTGSYCPGGKYTIEDDNKGNELCPSGYEFSDAGAKSNAQCYTSCTLASANIAHATEVEGLDYYGTGVDTCRATKCETGYHVDGSGIELVEKTPLVPINLTDRGAGFRYVRADGTSDSEGTVDAIPVDSVTAPNTWATAYSEGVVYGKASCQPKTDASIEYIMMSFGGILGGTIPMETVRSELEPLAGAAKAEYMAGMITDVTSGNKSESELYKVLYGVFMTEPNANYTTDSTGQYCYCQMDGFTPTGGTKEIVTSAPWVFNDVYRSADNCADNCAYNCANLLHSDDAIYLAFRAAVVGALGYTESGGICAANTINIDWNPDNGGDHIKNMCTYEGEITLPTPDPVKPGYTFTGWKLVE